ncbi:hypothetical protein F0562_013410 [Nyssa sinensis]|uniref:Uncharacterized protein n=1 Tax=Nyssa sinensis TaxID=561372 RepID=A0A5J4ZN61_9ASTE|nr:hypothetical protein F0562_013410 [Nyssa sinensis]
MGVAGYYRFDNGREGTILHGKGNGENGVMTGVVEVRVEDLDQRLKEKIVQVKEEVGLEFADVLKSLGLHMEPPLFSDVKGKVEEFNEGEV